mgnify:FL=1|tara:strand:+ start:929 stop:2029 length:1101 start_codon:yes stop_codon:yes gene_type:complete
MIFQPKNTKGKITQSNKTKNKINNLQSALESRTNTSLRFFKYFLFIFLGIIVGYILFIFSTEEANSIKNYFSNVTKKNYDPAKKTIKTISSGEKKSNFEIMYTELAEKQKDYQKLFGEKISGIDNKLSNIENSSKGIIGEVNNIIQESEKKIYSDINSIKFKLNEKNGNIGDFVDLSQRLSSLEVLLNNKINYFSMIITVERLKEAVQQKSNLSVPLNNLKYYIENSNNPSYLDVFLKIEGLLAEGIKTRGDLIILFEDIENSIFKENNLVFESKSFDNPVSYFSSLVKIKKIEDPDISEADNNFLKVRRFLYKNQLEEALNEIEKISPNYGQKFEGWIKSCRNLVKFEKLLNFFESMPIEPGNNN